MLPPRMLRIIRFVALACVCASAVDEARAATDAALFRIYFHDGAAIVSYGEYARLDDRVIVSMPVGGPADVPRLQVVTLPAGMVDWDRTERHAQSVRYQRYAATYGEADFDLLQTQIARVLSEIALTTDRARALAIAESARRTLADWPRSHYGYRQDDVREIVGLLDGAISRLRTPGAPAAFELSLTASAPVLLEPMASLPTPREQLDQIFRVLTMTGRAADRVALLQAAAALLGEHAAAFAPAELVALRRSAEGQLREELATDARYAALAQRVSLTAQQAAARAQIADVERVLAAIPQEDAKLGRLRPEMVQALQANVQRQLFAARQLRLLRDRWTIRRDLFRDYQRAVGAQILQLVKAQPSLEAIRRFEGPEPGRLQSLQSRLSGGAERLARTPAPEDLRPAHDLLVSAWRFAEGAMRARYQAIRSGNVDTAREASSAAAGALMMFARAQEEIRTFLEPPKLQ